MSNSLKYRIEKIGLWKTESGSNTVYILKQNWDFYFEEGYDDAPDLNEAGESFYVIWGDFQDVLYANRSKTCLSMPEAIKLAEDMYPGKVIWN
jgi:hypothetical protein